MVIVTRAPGAGIKRDSSPALISISAVVRHKKLGKIGCGDFLMLADRFEHPSDGADSLSPEI